MNESSEVLKFEEILKRNAQPKLLSLYDHSKTSNKHNVKAKPIYPEDVLTNVTLQLKAIQKADVVKSSKNENRKRLNKYKKSSFIPVNMLSCEAVPQTSTASKFETQFMLDTQLIDIIDNAQEFIDPKNDISQEFDNTFQENIMKTNNIKEIVLKQNSQDQTDNKNTKSNADTILIKENEAYNIKTDIVMNNESQFNDNSNEMLQKCIETVANIDSALDEEEDKNIPCSYVFKPTRNCETPSPIVFDLNMFEDFEKIAIPIIEEHTDLKVAKHMINSQIVGRELCINTDEQPLFASDNTPLSPVLKITTEKLKVSPNEDVNIISNSFENKDQIPMQELMTDSIFLKDEILFSSDEENEYVHKELQDLPLTCALETSFYNHSKALDKTMYVAFHTASNRSIQVLTDSFMKAKSLLDCLEDDDSDKSVGDDTNKVTLTELVDMCDSLTKKTSTININGSDVHTQANLNSNCTAIRNDVTKTNEDSISNDFSLSNRDKHILDASKNFMEIQQDDKMLLDKYVSKESKLKTPLRPVKRRFDGFMTASFKKIKLSDQALARSKRVFQDINIDDNFHSMTETTKTNVEDHKVKVNSKAVDIHHIDEDIINEFAQEMPLIESIKEKVSKEVVGFKTASKKNICISKTALARTKKIFEGINVNEQLNEDYFTCDIVPNNKAIENKVGINTHVTDLAGFKTASNKTIKISKEAIEKSKNILEDIVTDVQKGDTPNRLQNKNIDWDQPSTSKVPICGFRTANNHEIEISSNALAKSKNIFQDIDGIDYKSTHLISKDTFVGIETGDKETSKVSKLSEKSVADKKEALEANVQDFRGTSNSNIHTLIDHELEEVTKLQNEMCDDFNTVFDNEQSVLKEVLPKFCGFKTASNKTVKISEKAISESKKLFADLNVEDDLSYEEKIVNPNTKSKLENFTTKQDIMRSDSYGNDDLTGLVFNENNKSAFPGFKTASNKEVVISEKALVQSKKLFGDLEIDIDTTDYKSKSVVEKSRIPIIFDTVTREHIPTLELFQTASNKPMEVSDEALAKSKAIFKDIEYAESCIEDIIKGASFKNELQVFKGFETANKKPIKVSAQAIERSKALFRNIDNDDSNLVENSKDNENSEKVEILHINKEPIFRGFETASSKPVAISEEALVKSKLLLKDLDEERTEFHSADSKFQGFDTANNNFVSVSNEALLKSKIIFNDVQDNDQNVNLKGKDKQTEFSGFRTATEKKVLISEKALKECQHLFRDINNASPTSFSNISQIKPSVVPNDRNKDSNLNKTPFSFKSASNNNIEVSERALITSRRLLKDNYEVVKVNSEINKRKSTKPQDNLVKLIDTQVINNFEETLCTEDFCKDTTPKQSKRSGSPILSCPKAKKRKKFETPYRNNALPKPVITPKIYLTPETKANNDSELLFSEDYKRNKRYSLKDLTLVENNKPKSNTKKYSSNIFEQNFDTLLNFEFTSKRNDLTNTAMTTDDMKEYFLNAVNKKLVPEGWLDNHIRLIIWKLLSYEVIFPNTLYGVCTVKNVLDQLKYRYDKELYNAERPALRKILEKDDVASKTMVLCVAGIYVDGVSTNCVTNVTSTVEILLTDGWYCLKATIDKMLTKLVYDEKISIGSKLVTNGAELMNCEQGVAPWEDTSSVRLKICGNSTRRARWDARLGYRGNGAILAPLSSVKPEGGKVSKLRLYVARVYPALYVEKFDDGSTVTRSERLENLHQFKCETERQTAMEKLYEEVETELSDQESQDSESSYNNKRKPHAVSQTDSGTLSLEERANKRRERILQNVEAKLHEKMESHGLNVARNVVSLLKVRVAGFHGAETVQVTKGLMSIWKPNDAITEIVKEGAWIEVMNVMPTAIRYSEIQISAGHHSLFRESKYKENEKILAHTKLLKRKCYPIKDVAKNPIMVTDYNEIDTAGFILQIDPTTADFESSKQLFQNMYLVDGERNIICINFWGGLKKFGYQNVLDTGQVVACINLQKRTGNTKKSIPHYRVTEFSYFTKTPKNVNARRMVDELVKIFSTLDKKKYIEECIIIKNNFGALSYVNNEKISPYRINNFHNLTKNRIFIDSPLAQKPVDDNLNLTGLDFESTFKQDTQELSPRALLRKKKVNEKIAKLKMYGEPPALSPIQIINKSSSAYNSFRSPLAANTNVASSKKVKENSRNESCEIQSSPVIALNRTYVKTVNPVKLNFSSVQDNSVEDVVDHFAEDFDGSPPLSLE